MGKNITLRLNEELLKRCKHAAIEEDKSVSQWVADLIATAVGEKVSHVAARKSALKYMEEGLTLGGKYLSREDSHER